VLGSVQRADLFGTACDEAVSRLVATVLRVLEPQSQRGRDRPAWRRPESAHGAGEREQVGRDGAARAGPPSEDCGGQAGLMNRSASRSQSDAQP
jgi:hypothetical protein